MIKSNVAVRNQLFIFLVSFFSIGAQAQYFQQRVNYKIDVTLNDNNHTLTGNEIITYHNNSPNTLYELYFHVWPNAYANTNTALAKEIFKSGDDRFLAAKESDYGFIDSLNFKVNDQTVSWNFPENINDVCRINLNTPLLPGDSITISTPFHVKIPSAEISRLGHTGQAYFISQWFPKPAVYDSKGWNYFPYRDQGEYFSEFGSFDVSITLPDNYLLAATGRLTDGANEFKWLLQKDSLTRTIKKFPAEDSSIVSSKNFKTLRYVQDSIHDFAWFADKKWHVLIDTITLPGSNKNIISQSFFNNREAKYWLNAPEYLEEGIKYHSNWIGEYPYDFVTAIDMGYATGNGMEYPMITAIGNYGDPFELEITIFHEVGHNWFYGILGSDEMCHPWIDEGFTNFYETRYVYTKYKNDSLHQLEKRSGFPPFIAKEINHRNIQYNDYLAGARQNTDQSPDMCSQLISNSNYHADVYYKSAISIHHLKSYLGDSLFDLCMNQFYAEWKFKHPQTDNVRSVFEKVSRKDLSWFFDDIINSTRKIDYKILAIKNINREATLTIKNAGQVAAPVSISSLRNGVIQNTTWLEGFKGKKEIRIACDSCDSFKIDPLSSLPELYKNNNLIKVNGLFKKTERLHLYAGTRAERSDETQLYYFPAAGWNYYNKFMAGAVIHNISFLEKRFEFNAMPLYAFGTKDLNGSGKLRYYIYPSGKKLQKITLQTGISKYSYSNDSYQNEALSIDHKNVLSFTKIDSRVEFSFRPKDAQENLKNTLAFRSIIINKDIPYFFYYHPDRKEYKYWQIKYERENLNPLKPTLKRFGFIWNEDFYNATIDFRGFMTYTKKDKGLSARFFAGYFKQSRNGTIGADYRMSLDGKSGSSDYLYDEIFLGRNEEKGILSKQFIADYAGFKAPTSFYRLSEKLMTGVNLSTTLPGILPFELFLDAGTTHEKEPGNGNIQISWELGVSLPLIKNTFIIYYPFAYSDDIKYAIESQKLNKSELIRFELHLNNLNPLEFIKKIYTQ